MANSLEHILTTSASGMSAQSIRLNTVASNLANAGSISGTEEGAYRTKYPVFSEITQSVAGLDATEQAIGGVQVTQIAEGGTPIKKYEPNNPLANEDGYIFVSDVNPIEEMTNMIDASREYQANVEVMNTTKGLLMQTLSVLKS